MIIDMFLIRNMLRLLRNFLPIKCKIESCSRVCIPDKIYCDNHYCKYINCDQPTESELYNICSQHRPSLSRSSGGVRLAPRLSVRKIGIERPSSSLILNKESVCCICLSRLVKREFRTYACSSKAQHAIHEKCYQELIGSSGRACSLCVQV